MSLSVIFLHCVPVTLGIKSVGHHWVYISLGIKSCVSVTLGIKSVSCPPRLCIGHLNYTVKTIGQFLVA